MEIIDISDTITLDDDKEYVVTGKTLYDDLEYVSLLNTKDYSMKFGVLVEDQIVMLDNEEDKEIIERLLPLLLQSISLE
jgi:hypothetical protein